MGHPTNTLVQGCPIIYSQRTTHSFLLLCINTLFNLPAKTEICRDGIYTHSRLAINVTTKMHLFEQHPTHTDVRMHEHQMLSNEK